MIRTPPVDIRMVARKAGVSIATVSRALNRVATVDAQLAARVHKAAKELKYMPNTQARGLVSGRSSLVGLIVSEITNPFFPELIQSFEESAVERGYEILIGSTNYSSDRMMQCVRRMVERKVEGVAVMTFGMDEDLLQELAGRGIPVVSIGSTKKLESATSIEVDYRKGIRQAIQHLAVLGHRRISFISGPLHLRAAKLRQDAYIASMAEIGIKVPASYMIEGDHKMEGGYAAAEECFKRGQLPTALLCSNDMTAIGVLHALSARGLKVPEDISIVGFDDIHMAQFTVPPLTSIRMAGSDLAKAAFHALPLYLDSQSKKPGEDQLPVPTSLVVRQTTGYAPHAVTSEKPIKRPGKNPQRRKASIQTGTGTKE